MDLFETIKNRYSCRKYKETTPSLEIIDKVMEAARIAPSAANKQPWRFIIVTDPAIRKSLFEAYERDWFIAAPVIVVACGLVEEGYRRAFDGLNYTWVDVAIAFDHLTLAATAMGLGTCWVGAFKKDAVKRLLGIPDPVDVIAMTPLGFPDDSNPHRPRKDMAHMFCRERWEPR